MLFRWNNRTDLRHMVFLLYAIISWVCPQFRRKETANILQKRVPECFRLCRWLFLHNGCPQSMHRNAVKQNSRTNFWTEGAVQEQLQKSRCPCLCHTTREHIAKPKPNTFEKLSAVRTKKYKGVCVEENMIWLLLLRRNRKKNCASASSSSVSAPLLLEVHLLFDWKWASQGNVHLCPIRSAQLTHLDMNYFSPLRILSTGRFVRKCSTFCFSSLLFSREHSTTLG